VTGQIVSRGKIRVDARKAVAKLREHLLVDLRDYVLELTRAAIASGAESIAIEHDANEFIIGWTGTPVADDAAENLLDHALADPANNEARRLRLLALGVNAALGLKPRWIDLYTANEGACTRVRFVPSLLDDDNEDAAPEKQSVELPEGMAANSVRIHVRERLSWHVVRRATGLAGPPELQTLQENCHHLPATIVVNGAQLNKAAAQSALLRTKFDVPNCRSAFVELMPVGFPAASLELLEQGVRLTHALWTCRDLPGTPAELPVRIVVDAHALPTNASRSEVRQETSLYRHVLETSRAALMSTLETLLSGAELPPHMEQLGPREKVEHAAAQILGIVVKEWSAGRVVNPTARRLLDAKVLRDGCGNPLAYSQLEQRVPVQTYQAEHPLEDELALWMREVVWLRGSPFELPLQRLQLQDVGPFIERAREGVERRKSFLAHEPSDVAVIPSENHIVTARFEPDGRFAGLRGEVAICNAPLGSRGAVIRIFHEDRPLAVFDVESRFVPLPLDIALTWPGRVLPTWSFDGAQHNRTSNEAMAFAVMAGVALAAKNTSLVGNRPEMRALLRAAIGTALQCRLAFGVDDEFDLEQDAPELLRARIWPTTNLPPFLSIADLRKRGRRHGAVFVAEPGTQGKPVGTRRVVAASRAELAWMLQVLRSQLDIVSYQPGVLDRSQHDSWEAKQAQGIETAYASLRAAVARAPYIEFERPTLRGRVGVGLPSRIARLHAGVPLETTNHRSRFGFAHLVMDDDETVPNSAWTHAQVSSANVDIDDDLELELLTEVAAALEGDTAARQRVFNWPDPLSPYVKKYVLESITKLRNELAVLRDADVQDGPDSEKADVLGRLHDRLMAAPLILMMNVHNKAVLASPRNIQAEHPFPDRVPALMEIPEFNTLDWRPIIEPAQHLWPILARAVGSQVEDGRGAFAERRRAAVANELRLEILAAPAEPLDRMNEAADPKAPIAASEVGVGEERVSVAATLPASMPATNELKGEILYKWRPVMDARQAGIELPVVVRVCLHDKDMFAPDWLTLTEGGRGLAKQRILVEAGSLVVKLLQKHSPMDDPRMLLLISSLLESTPGSDIKPALRKQKWCPTVQKTAANVEALSRSGVVYYSTNQYARWWSAKRGFTELDRPILYMPLTLAPAFAFIFAELELELKDVTDAVAALQTQRSGGETTIPTLSGDPVHPRLRETAAELGLIVANGEVQLNRRGAADVVVRDIHGASHQLNDASDLAISAVFNIEGLADEPTFARVRQELTWAVGKWLVRLSEHLDDLPEFVRGHIRQRIWARATAAAPVLDEFRQARVWPDIRGNWHSIESVLDVGHKRVWFTMRDAPYPEHDFKRTILKLDPRFSEQLDDMRKLLPLNNASKRLDNMLASEARQHAAQRAEFHLSASVKAACIATARLDGPMVGELGVLPPGATHRQEVEVYKTRRPVCTLDEDFPWPLVAVVNDDSFETGPYFDKLIAPADRALRYSLHGTAMELLRSQIVAPAYALASAWIDNTAELDDESKIAVVGRVWLAPSWKQDHSVRLTTRRTAMTTTLRRLHGSPMFNHELPVEGNLFVMSQQEPKHLQGFIAELVSNTLASMLRAAEQDFPDSAEQLEGYRWLLWLMDAKVGIAPKTKAVDGSWVDPGRVLKELHTRGALWYRGEDGEADGAFPDGEYAFMLAEKRSPVLIDVLKHRMARVGLKQLGGGAHLADSIELEDTPAEPEAVEPQTSHFVADEPEKRSWFRDAVSSITSIWSSDDDDDARAEVKPKEPVEPPHPAAVAIGRELNILDMPLHQIVLSTDEDSAIDYHKRKLRVSLNPNHPSVAPVLAETASPATRAALIAAIVSEINRAHRQITAADELRALTQLLTQAGG